jgi:hypothetical protein
MVKVEFLRSEVFRVTRPVESLFEIENEKIGGSPCYKENEKKSMRKVLKRISIGDGDDAEFIGGGITNGQPDLEAFQIGQSSRRILYTTYTVSVKTDYLCVCVETYYGKFLRWKRIKDGYKKLELYQIETELWRKEEVEFIEGRDSKVIYDY